MRRGTGVCSLKHSYFKMLTVCPSVYSGIRELQNGSFTGSQFGLQVPTIIGCTGLYFVLGFVLPGPAKKMCFFAFFFQFEEWMICYCCVHKIFVAQAGIVSTDNTGLRFVFYLFFLVKLQHIVNCFLYFLDYTDEVSVAMAQLANSTVMKEPNDLSFFCQAIVSQPVSREHFVEMKQGYNLPPYHQSRCFFTFSNIEKGTKWTRLIIEESEPSKQ